MFDLLTTTGLSDRSRELTDFASREDGWDLNVLTLSWDVSQEDSALRVYYTHACENGSLPPQLVEAVDRQQSFVRKMEQQLWIRSPAVDGTLRRALDRYQKFLKLFKIYPKEMFVPTLDIDLVWHTHQCSSERYKVSVEALTGKFVNHNDKLGTPVLSGGLQRTKQLWKIRFSEEYVRCLCWDCEAILSAVEAVAEPGGGSAQFEQSASRIVADIELGRAVALSSRAR